MTQLMAHCGTSRAPEEVVMAIPAPEWTDTWHPVSHGQVIKSLSDATKRMGLGVRNTEYSLSKDGARMFGVWHLDAGTSSMGYALGMRNSTDKSLLLGVCAGTSVFVCDNLCFSGSFIKFRKHTSGLDLDELQLIGMDAVQGAVVEMEKLGSWQEGLQDYWVPVEERKQLIYDMATKGVFAGGQLGNYHDALNQELEIRRGHNLDNSHSLYNLHGAATRLMRGWNLERVAKSSTALATICDDYIERRTA